MAEVKTRNVSFPRYAEYNCAFKYIVEQALGCKYVMPPALTKRTMELGAKYSPEFVCTPFKTIQIPGDDGVIVREIVLGKTEWKIYASAGGKVSYTGASAASGERYSLKAGEPFVIISDCELEFVSE